MKSQKTHINTLLNFSRWSRKAYAAFISIGRIVKISALKTEVAQGFIKKSKSFIEILDFFSFNKNNDDKNEEDIIHTSNPLVFLALETQATVSHSGNFNNTIFLKRDSYYFKREQLFTLFYFTNI